MTIDDRSRSELPQYVVVALRCRADHGCSGDPGRLDSHQPDSPGCTVDEDGVAGLDACCTETPRE